MAGLRDYQAEAIRQARACYRKGARSILIVGPTGMGKTRVGVELAQSALAKGGTCLWLAHRQELIQQAAEALRREGARPGIVAPWAPYDASAPILVASVQTLLARGLRPACSMLVLDEAHHHVAEQWGQIAAHYREATRIGLTATPERQDGVGLGNLFSDLVVAAQPRDLIERGFLVRAHVYGPSRRVKALSDDPVSAYKTRGKGAKAIVFAASVKACKQYCEAFSHENIAAKAIVGDMDSYDRQVAIERFKEGSVRVLVGVHTLTEGFDVPDASVCILARGFSYPGSYIQAVGRVMRPAPGKDHAIVLDLMGVSHDHGLPEADRHYSLEGKAICLLQADSSVAATMQLKACAVCGRMFQASAYAPGQCPHCGAPYKGRQAPGVKARQMSRVFSTYTESSRAQELRRLIILAKSKGYKPGWAFIQYKARFGSWPPDTIRVAAGWR